MTRGGGQGGRGGGRGGGNMTAGAPWTCKGCTFQNFPNKTACHRSLPDFSIVQCLNDFPLWKFWFKNLLTFI